MGFERVGEGVAEMTASDLYPASAGGTGARPGLLYRWGMLVARRKRVVFAVWVVLLIAGLAFLRQFSSSLSSGMTWVPGSQSSQAAALLARDLPAAGGNQAVLVFSSRTLTAPDPGFQRVVATAARKISAIPGVGGIQLPSGAAARGLVAPGGHTALAVAALPSSETEAVKLIPRLDAAAAAAATPGVRAGVTGEPALDRDGMTVANSDIARADRVGMPLAVLVLLVVFGSLVAAGLPLLLALASLLVTFGGFGAFYLVTGTSLSTVLESVTLMIGLGIGIDYALFVITRFREELGRGKTPAIASAAAAATAGRTVLVSGSTVIVALAPLLLVNNALIREVAAGPMIAVAVLASAAVSLLPAALAGLGPRVNRLALPLPRWLRWSGQPRTGSRLTALVLRRPLIVLLSGVAVLGGLAAFTLQLNTGYDYGLSALRNQPSGRADTAIAAAFGPGAISPTQVVFTTTGNRPLSARDLQAIAALDTRLASDPRVASVTSLPVMLGGPAAAARTLAAARTSPALAASLSPVVNARHGATLTVMTINPRTVFTTAQASQLVTSLRAELPAALRGTGMRASVGGATAAVTDLTHEINAKTPLVMALIVIIALVLLGAAFGSPLVALIGLAGTMLSVGAAYGLLHCVFQAGHAGDIFGYHSTGFVEAFLPLILFAILVGPSTDYQVFLISRIKEEWETNGHDPAAAIAAGLQRSGRVILSAATIMIVVFGSFVLTTYVVTKELGFALAVVILIDAAITRRLLVPAALRLLGNHAWTWSRPRAPRRARRQLTTQP
jgi:putative drug exporter of the RND superfamily